MKSHSAELLILTPGCLSVRSVSVGIKRRPGSRGKISTLKSPHLLCYNMFMDNQLSDALWEY